MVVRDVWASAVVGDSSHGTCKYCQLKKKKKGRP